MIETFIKWLDKEVESLEYNKDEEKMFVLGKYFEAVRIRAKFLNLLAEFKLKNPQKEQPKETEVLDMLNELWKKRIDERANHD